MWRVRFEQIGILIGSSAAGFVAQPSVLACFQDYAVGAANLCEPNFGYDLAYASDVDVSNNESCRFLLRAYARMWCSSRFPHFIFYKCRGEHQAHDEACMR